MKLVFVTPWYGQDIPGGAEAWTRRTVEHLHVAGMDVEVWTTCVRDLYSDWGKNHHRPGSTKERDVPVRRFPVKPRDKLAFDQINMRLINGYSVTLDEEQVFIEQMLRVDGLYEHIEQHAQDALLFFIPYMFATTYYGAQVRPERSYLIPCFHDEAYARLDIYRRAFMHIKGMLFLSEPERSLARQLYPLDGMHTQVIGAAVDLDARGDAQAFRRKTGIDAPFVLYAGRRERGKNIELLIDYFRQYRAARQTDVQLVLIGPGHMPVAPAAGEGIIDVGFVSPQEKWDAYAAASVLCQPSLHESLSLVLMESWVMGTPVLVHAEGAVTRDHCQRANGGLYFGDYAEFAACLDVLLSRSDLRERMGQQGRAYVCQNFGWDTFVDRFHELLAREDGA